MKENNGTKGMLDQNQAMWAKLPKTGEVLRALEKSVVDISGANPASQTYWVGPTTTHMPVPTPTPTPAPGETQPKPLDARDFPGRYASEVPGIGPKYAQRLTKGGMENLATLASAVATDVAQILSVSEVKAMGFINKAGLLLQSRSGNDQAGR